MTRKQINFWSDEDTEILKHMASEIVDKSTLISVAKRLHRTPKAVQSKLVRLDNNRNSDTSSASPPISSAPASLSEAAKQRICVVVWSVITFSIGAGLSFMYHPELKKVIENYMPDNATTDYATF